MGLSHKFGGFGLVFFFRKAARRGKVSVGASRGLGVRSQLLGPCWRKAGRTGANWVLPRAVQGANSISGDSRLPRLTFSLIIYCLVLGKDPLFAYSVMTLL